MQHFTRLLLITIGPACALCIALPTAGTPAMSDFRQAHDGVLYNMRLCHAISFVYNLIALSMAGRMRSPAGRAAKWARGRVLLHYMVMQAASSPLCQRPTVLQAQGFCSSPTQPPPSHTGNLRGMPARDHYLEPSATVIRRLPSIRSHHHYDHKHPPASQ